MLMVRGVRSGKRLTTVVAEENGDFLAGVEDGFVNLDEVGVGVNSFHCLQVAVLIRSKIFNYIFPIKFLS